jgi:hypothetical protein
MMNADIRRAGGIQKSETLEDDTLHQVTDQNKNPSPLNQTLHLAT